MHILRSSTATAGTKILRTGQVVPKAFFIREGRVKVVIREHSDGLSSGKAHHLATLSKGSSFNFLNSFMGRPCIFDFVAIDHVQFCVLKQDDYQELTCKNEELLIVKNKIITECLKGITKYDYNRMVYSSINQMQRA